jgi:hypothetical protein
MQVFDTIALPFCIITIAAVPEKVETLHDLPDFLIPVKWKSTSIAGASSLPEVDLNATLDAKVALYFSDVVAPELKSNRKQTTKDMFLASNVMGLIERSILFSLDKMGVRRKVREHIGEGDESKVRTYDVADFTETVRGSLAGVLSYHAMSLGGHVINSRVRKDNNVIERVTLDLGGGVLMYTKPLLLEAPAAGNNRFRGTVDMYDGPHNFYMMRPVAPSVFRQFVTDDVLYTAYLNALEDFNKTRAGKALELADSLDFVGDDVKMTGSLK